jgi:PAS domain S-box-containing protein
MKKPVRPPGKKRPARGISSCKDDERSLRLLRFAMEHTSEAVFFADKNGRFFYANPAACRHLGYREEELSKLSIWDIDPSYSPKVRTSLWSKLKEKGVSAHFETTHRRRDGCIVPVDVTVNHIEFEGEGFNISFCRDISRRKQDEATLRQSEELLGLFVENAPAAIAMLDRQMR